MGVATRIIKKVPRYYRRFGFAGLSILYRQKRKGSKPLCFCYRREFAHPIYMRRGNSDFPIFQDVLVDDCYNIDFGFTPKTILDCGANIGMGTIYFANRFPEAKIVAVEPETSNFEMLKMNTQHYSNVCLYCNGIWNKSASLKVEDKGYGDWGFMVSEVPDGTSGSIKAISIPDIMREQGIDTIDVLKLDIEGSEKELFESGYENWLPFVKVIIIELHDRMREGASKSFFSALTKYSFSLSHKGENIICFMK